MSFGQALINLILKIAFGFADKNYVSLKELINLHLI